MSSITPRESSKTAPDQAPLRVITARDCFLEMATYACAAGLAVFLLPNILFSSWVGWTLFVVGFITSPFYVPQDLRTIWRTSKPITLTPLQSERRANTWLRWGALNATLLTLLVTINYGLFFHRSLFVTPNSSKFAFVFLVFMLTGLSIPALVLWKQVAKSNRYLVESERTKSLTVTESAPENVSTPATAPSPPRHWWTNTETRDEIQRTERK